MSPPNGMRKNDVGDHDETWAFLVGLKIGIDEDGDVGSIILKSCVAYGGGRQARLVVVHKMRFLCWAELKKKEEKEEKEEPPPRSSPAYVMVVSSPASGGVLARWRPGLEMRLDSLPRPLMV